MVDIASVLAPVSETLPLHLSGRNAVDQLEHLRARMGARDVTVEEVWDYIALNHQPAYGMVMQQLALFVTPQDLVNFWMFHDWWAPVPDKPQNLPTPSIIQFCWYVNHLPTAPAVTFHEAMMVESDKRIAYCNANNLNPQNPGESREDRAKRLNRERMAKTRSHRKTPEKLIKHDDVLLQTVRAMEAQCDDLKREAKAAEEAITEEVKLHQAAMNEAAQRRRDCVADYKSRIDALRQDIRNLTAKQ
jgi:hypothetical protein